MNQLLDYGLSRPIVTLVLVFCPPPPPPPLLLPQETETTGQGPGGSEGGEGVTDVIQQLLELSEQVSEETAQPQPPEPAIAMETAINQDILQVSRQHSQTK